MTGGAGTRDEGSRGRGQGRRRIRVVVADDQHGYRRGLRAVLELDDAVTVVGEARDGDEATELCRRLGPDLVLLDVRMPGGGGVGACLRIRRALPAVRVLMVTASDDHDDLFDAIRAGAHGYLLKDAAGEQVLEAVERVMDGQAVIPPRLAAVLLEEFGRLASSATSDPPPQGEPTRLTHRETEILRLIARGMANRSIAVELSLSEHTVKNHVRNILEKLHVHSRTEAAVYAHRQRISGADA